MANMNSTALGAVLAVAAMAMSGPASAALTSDALARNIAGVARSTEIAHKGPGAALEGEVRTATQDLISVSATPPGTVKVALELVLKVCSDPKAGKQGLDCPSQTPSFAALQKLLVVVNGLVQDATADTSNSPALDVLPLPIQGGGGSDYRRAP